jgi:hypothetical protein
MPGTYMRIGISRRAPRGQRGFKMYKGLAPGSWFNSVDAEDLRRRYMHQLSLLNPRKVLAELCELADGRVASLLCFERPPPDPAWCHRGLVSAWFKDELGIDVPELGHESLGCGWSHPKLHASLHR